MPFTISFRTLSKLTVGLSVGLAALAGQPASASVMDYSLDSYVGGGSMNLVSSPYGNVELNDNGGSNVTVTVTLSSGVGFVNTGAGYSLTWDLQGGPTIAVSALTTGFSLLSSSAGTVSASGSGSWDYALTCDKDTCGTGGNAPYTGMLSFVVDNVGLSDFVANASGNYFSADVCLGVSSGKCGAGGITGVIVAGIPPSTSDVPEPASMTLLAGSLGALAFFRRRAPLPPSSSMPPSIAAR